MFAKKLQNDQNEYLIIDDNGSEYFSKDDQSAFNDHKISEASTPITSPPKFNPTIHEICNNCVTDFAIFTNNTKKSQCDRRWALLQKLMRRARTFYSHLLTINTDFYEIKGSVDKRRKYIYPSCLKLANKLGFDSQGKEFSEFTAFYIAILIFTKDCKIIIDNLEKEINDENCCELETFESKCKVIKKVIRLVNLATK